MSIKDGKHYTNHDCEHMTEEQIHRAITTGVSGDSVAHIARVESPYTWVELEKGMAHVLEELAALTDNELVPECLRQVAENLDTALCDMQYELNEFMMEVWSDVCD